MRDNQRQRVYNWEREQFATFDEVTLPEIDDVHTFAQAALEWRASWDTVRPRADFRARNAFRRKHWVRVHKGRANASAHGSPHNWRITMPLWARTQIVACHELAHVFVGYDPRGGSHGPDFVAEYLGLLTDLVGLDYGSLVRSARDAGVEVANNYWRGFDGSPNVPARGVPYEKRDFRLY